MALDVSRNGKRTCHGNLGFRDYGYRTLDTGLASPPSISRLWFAAALRTLATTATAKTSATAVLMSCLHPPDIKCYVVLSLQIHTKLQSLLQYER